MGTIKNGTHGFTASKILKTKVPDFGIFQREITNGIQTQHSKANKTPGNTEASGTSAKRSLIFSETPIHTMLCVCV